MERKVKQMMTTLPLEFLLAQGGIYADYVKQRCCNALKLLFAGVWENTTAAAMEKWKVRLFAVMFVVYVLSTANAFVLCYTGQSLVRAQRAEEAQRLYRFNQGKRRLRNTMLRYFRRIHRGKKSVVWAWWVKRTHIIRAIEFDRASRVVRCCKQQLVVAGSNCDVCVRSSNATSVATLGAHATRGCCTRSKPEKLLPLPFKHGSGAIMRGDGACFSTGWLSMWLYAHGRVVCAGINVQSLLLRGLYRGGVARCSGLNFGALSVPQSMSR